MDVPIHNANVRYSSYTPAQKRATQKYRVNNKDKVNEQRKKYYETRKENDPEFLAYKRQKAKEYYQRKKGEDDVILDPVTLEPVIVEPVEPVDLVEPPEEVKSTVDQEVITAPKVKRVYKKKVKVVVPEVPAEIDTPPSIPEPEVIDVPPSISEPEVIDVPLELVEVKPKKPIGRKMFIPPVPPKE